jgi:chorismate--pyruvate lyase
MTSNANISANPRKISWVIADQLSGLNPPERMLSWLREPGLLTSKVQQHCKTSFTLELLTQDIANSGWLRYYANWASDTGYHREIVMHCDGIPGLYAETIVPDGTATQYPWIKSLGTQPLGKGLQLIDNVSRSEFEFAYIPTGGLPEVPASFLSNDLGTKKPGHGLWARRSTYTINGYDLFLIEVFLSAITAANTEEV